MTNKLISAVFMLLLLCSSVYAAESEEELELFGLEVEKMLNLGSALLAAFLSALTFISYHRTGNKRLLYVTVAFGLFAAKSFLVGAEIFFGEWSWVDNFASIADFGILLSFFAGLIQK